MGSRTLRLFSAAVVIGVVAAACSSSSSGGTITIGGDKANDHGSKNVSGVSTVELQAKNVGSSTYFFDPTVLTGSAGQKLTITVKNAGDTTHNFTLGSISKDIPAGQSATVSVTFPASGSTEFFCRFHRSLGMAGELTAA
jgi:plastocyanin